MAANESLSVNFNNLRDLYMKFELAEGICLPVLSVLTVSTNILLLIAIWKDPEKNFRSPTTYFLIGLAIADLLTGMSTEPFFAVYHIMNFQSGGKPIPRVVTKLYNIGQSISTVTISSSYLIILGLSISQYIAIKWPHKYKVLITRNRVIEVQRRRSYRKSDNQKGTVRGKSENLQRQFVIVTFYLAAILLISALPHIAIQFVWLYVALSEEGLYYTFMALRVRDLLLFLKVALDAFIYAWRLPSYRKALKRSINHSRRDSKSSVEVKG
ncbi:hypothetical protein pdam_00010419 [Pocillopora damicornis]|uniref:G-protein coupled receptors family 1 profile domain-containing protein n=1 Tax=Pocillopora damicornis TaxID=46731 RepID=A0A3M6UA26_POCDA|nr:hypothetical protein pdam_00010419 [Pocillopora damicornis]